MEDMIEYNENHDEESDNFCDDFDCYIYGSESKAVENYKNANYLYNFTEYM